jgi:hypothetical protein
MMQKSPTTIVQSICDTLPIDFEALVVKVHKYFHILTVSVTELQRFSHKADTEHYTSLQRGNT